MKHTLKSILSLALVCLMLTVLALPAAADVIIEPSNLFYVTHSKQCEYLRVRHYVANSDSGYVYLYQSPDNTITVGSYPNGDKLAVTWLYTAPGGEEWGLIADESGWLKLSDLSLVYDSREFLKDHEAECVPFEAKDYGEIGGTEAQPVLTWTYPGGEKGEFEIKNGNVVEFVSTSYTDTHGTVWGHINYMYGMRDFWVCLSKPYDETVGGTALSEHEITLRQDPVPADDIPVSSNNMVMLVVAGVLIVGVVVGTAAIIRVSFAKKKAK